MRFSAFPGIALAMGAPTAALGHGADMGLGAQVHIPKTEIHTLQSEFVGDDFELWIAHPQPGFIPSNAPPVVLYLLDANLYFGTAVEVTRLMHRLFGELPPILVVGIAYSTENWFTQSALRTRDFTPSEDTRFAEMATQLPTPPDSPEVSPSMGGAAAFLRSLMEEVQPFVRQNYEANEAGSTLFGSSLGGLFVTYAFHTAPRSFDNFVAVSPALWWDEGMVFDLDLPHPEPGEVSPTVYLAVGGLEESPDVPALAEYKLISNAERMAGRLKGSGYPEGSVHFQILDGETHTSVVPVALTRALRRLLVGSAAR